MTDYKKGFSVDGKVALVTGAARGLGAETARALAQVGAKVLVTDILEGPGRETVEAIKGAGGQAEFLRHDVTDEAQWEGAVAHAVSAFGGLDILVNNAGMERMAFITDCKVEDFRRLLDVNVTGTFLGLKHAIGAMRPGGAAGRGGSIINLSSIAGLIGVTALGAYCASKGAVRLLTKSAAVECAQLRYGIRVNSIHPGVVWTQMGEDFLQHFVDLKLVPDRATAEAAFKAATPMGVLGEPADVVAAVLYLASDATKWVTGTETIMDGGYTAV
jgi:3alpha(or 20beta)-hydroxysteroid dehydrogenase